MLQDCVERRRACFDEDRVMNAIQHPQEPDGGSSKPSLVEFGALIGDPVRAAMLLALGDGSRRPAGELSGMAGASPQAGSAHLARLVAGGLLAVEKQGRHRFFRIASGEVAEIIEGLANWTERPVRPIRHDPALCHARLCYDHLAGRLGVAVLEAMSARGLFRLRPRRSCTQRRRCRLVPQAWLGPYSAIAQSASPSPALSRLDGTPASLGRPPGRHHDIHAVRLRLRGGWRSSPHAPGNDQRRGLPR